LAIPQILGVDRLKVLINKVVQAFFD